MSSPRSSTRKGNGKHARNGSPPGPADPRLPVAERFFTDLTQINTQIAAVNRPKILAFNKAFMAYLAAAAGTVRSATTFANATAALPAAVAEAKTLMASNVLDHFELPEITKVAPGASATSGSETGDTERAPSENAEAAVDVPDPQLSGGDNDGTAVAPQDVNAQAERPAAPKRRKPISTALQGKIAEALVLLARMTSADADGRFALAKLVSEIMTHEATYGDGAIKLGRAIGVSAPALYRHAQVASTWDDAEFAALTAKRISSGKPLSWSHVLEVAQIADQAQRDEIIAKILAENLSVKATRAALRPKGEVAQGSDGPFARTGVDLLHAASAAADKLIAKLSEYSGQIAGDDERAVVEHLLGRIDEVDRVAAALREAEKPVAPKGSRRSRG